MRTWVCSRGNKANPWANQKQVEANLSCRKIDTCDDSCCIYGLQKMTILVGKKNNDIN